MKRTTGIALLIVVGILTLLALAGAGMAGFAAASRALASAAVETAQARLLARSGMEYAVARLTQDPAPRPGDASTQADDWICREGVGRPLDRAANPSYAQTEPYSDAAVPGAESGRYDEGADTYSDQNGNGRFDSWSGRFRGGRGPSFPAFRLKISGNDSRLAVNDGWLDAAKHQSYDISGNPVDNSYRSQRHQDKGERFVVLTGPPFYNYDPPSSNNFPPLYDTLAPHGVVRRNRRVADLLNELGRIVGTARPLIGDFLIENRPLGGYSSPTELQALLGTDWEKIGDFVTVSLSGERVRFWGSNYPAEIIAAAGFFDPPGVYAAADVDRYNPRRTPVHLSDAPEPVLRALVQGMSAGWSEVMGESHAPAQILVTVNETEAARLAGALAQRRSFPSWYAFFQWLDANKTLLFPGDPLSANRKVNAVDLHLNPDDLEAYYLTWPPTVMGDVPPMLGPLSWQTYDLPRGAEYLSGDPRILRYGKTFEFRRILNPPPPRSAVPSVADVYGCWGGDPLLLDPRGRFQVECLGRSGLAVARTSGVADLYRTVEDRQQADFENRSGCSIMNDRALRLDRPKKDRTQTFPLFPIDSCGDAPASAAFCEPSKGTIRLMDRSPGPRGGTECFYLPCWEKGQPERPGDWSSGTRGNFEDAVGKAFPCRYPRPPFQFWDDKAFPGTSGFLEFQWGAGGGANPGAFPAADPASGEVSQGTIELMFTWGTSDTTNLGQLMLSGISGAGDNPIVSLSTQTNVFNVDPCRYQVVWYRFTGFPTDTFMSIAMIPMPESHPVVFTFSAEQGLQGYIDGVPDPGLRGDYPTIIFDTTKNQRMQLNFSDEVRLDAQPRSPAAISGAALDPRYWVPGDGGKEVPFFESPLCRIASPVKVTAAGWDGFVPKLIRDATDDWNAANPPGERKVPVRVEIAAYTDEAGLGPERSRALPESFWRDGGGWAPIDLGEARSFRYRVRMDASAPTALGKSNNETPVFDSIGIQYATGGFWTSWSGD